MDIQITIVDPVTGIVTLGLTNYPKKLIGMDLLAQIVALKMLKTWDQDVFDPQEGTNFRQYIGQYNFSEDDFEEVRLLVVSQIKKVEQDIIAEQGTNIGTPSERLSQLRLLDVASDPTTGSIAARVQILNEAGGSRDLVV